jgi:hypothetical protein
VDRARGRRDARARGGAQRLGRAGRRGAGRRSRRLTAPYPFHALRRAPRAARASARPPAPHLLERNQALRYALLDAQHCATLLRYAAALTGARGDEELRALLDRFAGRLGQRLAASGGALGEWIDPRASERRTG